jgi:mannose-6-phosphate isomerase-like protein (cupin superfamily)
MDTMTLPVNPDYTAPDGSEIRLLPSFSTGGLCHCQIARGRTSKPVRHRAVEEIWYILEGTGEMWRRFGSVERIDQLQAGTAVTIPFQTHFQFRNTGDGDLKAVIVTIPGWPGAEEAVPVEGKWPESH